MGAAKRPAKLRHRVVRWLGFAYPVALLCAALALRYGGERWWVTGVGLYLPRVVFAAPLPLLAISLAVLERRLLWTQALATFLVVFTLMGLTLPSPGAADERAPRIRVLSYNVNSAIGGAEDVAMDIDRHSPDVVLLQETGGSESLAAAMRARYPSVLAEGQFVVASRYSILSSFEPDKLPYDGRLRSARYLALTLDTPLGPLAFYDVHPESPREAFRKLRGHGLRREILSGRLFSATSAHTFLENNGLREAQVEAFSEHAERETLPVVIAGDTNLPGLSYVLHRYLSRYQDGFSEAGGGFGYTFPAARPWMRIDRILASRELRFSRFDVGSHGASDHLCVVAELRR